MIVDIPDAAIEWLRSGERGSSSEAIFERMTGLPVSSSHFRGSPPSDPADLRRCLLLLEAVPEFHLRLDEMASVSATWASLVPLWNELVATMIDEAPGWRDGGGAAPRTYALMKAVIYGTRPL